MRNMSFSMTTEQARNKTKGVTRRQGWWHAKPGELIQQGEKGMGLKKGEKVKKIHVIRLTDVRAEPLENITLADVILEGFPDWSREDFIEFYCDTHKILPRELCNRIAFGYV